MVSELVGRVRSGAERTLLGHRADDDHREGRYQRHRMPPPEGPSLPRPLPGVERVPVPQFMQRSPIFTPDSDHDSHHRYEPSPSQPVPGRIWSPRPAPSPRRAEMYSPRAAEESPPMPSRGRAPDLGFATRLPRLTADDLAGGQLGRPSFQATDDSLPHRSFVDHLRAAYKDSIVDVARGRVRVNFAQLNRVVLECAQKRLVDSAFEFTYDLRDADLEMFTTRTDMLLAVYGDVALILLLSTLFCPRR